MLRSELETDRIGTVLDTCHAMLAEKYMTVLYDEAGDYPTKDYSMREYFNQNARFIKLIHLCDIKGSGYGKGRHGVPFTTETVDKCYDILDLYEYFNLDCPITLEVEETNFDICDGYASTKGIVDEYYQRGSVIDYLESIR